MGFKELKDKGLGFIAKLSKDILVKIVISLRDQIEDLFSENRNLKEEVQTLKDQLNKAKGEKGKPNIKPSIDPDDKKDLKTKKTRRKNHKKGSKKSKIKITRAVRLKPDSKPADVEYKGIRTVVVQDIVINLDNISFEIERYYSKKEKTYYEGSIPAEYKNKEFGPGLITLIQTLHYQGRMTQNRLHEFLKSLGIIISSGQLSEIITKGYDGMEEEFKESRESALKKSLYQQIDDTGARISGRNAYTTATGNDYFTSYKTGFKKDRRSALSAITNNKLKYLLNDDTLAKMRLKLSKNIVETVETYFAKQLYYEDEFNSKIDNTPEIMKYNYVTIKNIKDICAISAYHEGHLGKITKTLVCDDAGQFKELTDRLQLCWIHEGRHYKKLTPAVAEHVDELKIFLNSFWIYYDKLKKYKNEPSIKLAKKLKLEFDTIFTPNKSYKALNSKIKLTLKKKESLLTVLIQPELPIHNNSCELDVREKVVQRKIRNCHRSMKGVKASDLYLSIMATCRKNKITFYEFLKDRYHKQNNILPLSQIIYSIK
jgi:hypothetical protein